MNKSRFDLEKISIDRTGRKSPVNLDMCIPEQGRVSTIIRFPDTDTIEMADSLNGMARPAAFEDSQILVRIKEI